MGKKEGTARCAYPRNNNKGGGHEIRHHEILIRQQAKIMAKDDP